MVIAILAAVAAMNGTPDTCAQPSPNYTQASVHVASVNNPTYSFPGVDNRAAVNGRIYKGRVIVGGHEVGAKTAAADAAVAYGALGEEGVRVQAQVEGLMRIHPVQTVEFSPWTPVQEQQASPYSDAYSRGHQKMARRAEEARQQWLKDNNYVGGVRTHVNDAVLHNLPQAKPQTTLPAPRGVIEVNPEVPAFKSRMQVNAGPASLTKIASRGVVKVLPKDGVKVEKTEQVIAAAQK
jgi:hypothetical protein